MTPGHARRWIDRHFGSQKRYAKTQANPPPETEFIEALEQVPAIHIEKDAEQSALELFLYNGCLKFGRWFAPSPPSVPRTHSDIFKKFATRLYKVERQRMNGPIFLIHSIRNDIYAAFSEVPLPLTTEKRSTLRGLGVALADVKIPNNPIKMTECKLAKAEVEQIIAGLDAGNLKSHLRTNVPYPLTRQPLAFRTIWNGITVSGSLIPSFSTPPMLLTQVAPPAVLAPRTSTRWQYGQTRIELEFSALIDPSLQVPSLQLPAIEPPVDAWPNGLRIAFELIYQVCWELRSRREFISIWIPAPGDLGEIESWLDVEINYIRRGHPSMLYEAFVPISGPLELDLGSLAPIPWHKRCRVLAEQYAMFGETREALFWLNVGVEALLGSRMEAKIAAIGAGLDLDRLDGADAYWNQAKEAVRAKFPDLVDEIEWPQSGQKPSRFRQIKYFCRNLPGVPEVAQVLANYSRVACKRNALFHGESEDPISIEDIRRAAQGFDWIVTNFCPEMGV